MSRRSRRRHVVEGAEKGLEAIKTEVMRREGYSVDPARPDDVKYEVAQSLGVPLKAGNNGRLTTEEAGRVGGPIGGAMVREMVKMAKEQLVRNRSR
ncbi:alpha/beta-type small acid-soluble spore protein [Paenibacillus aurantius]|uniref:Alpha/beta-type small acid-soluble spore protein n=1 Tax=Paenibacillus aurantius TaxID=2918900 RepID=A0AA96LC56_9BACL|nr:alpha/beta-type small acid-soluble spore protein [Paenibacillus aurantius]WNQ10399.1 alpha/beta-type small acid-soluble spore protein [Paenibacillus aurantius]